MGQPRVLTPQKSGAGGDPQHRQVFLVKTTEVWQLLGGFRLLAGIPAPCGGSAMGDECGWGSGSLWVGGSGSLCGFSCGGECGCGFSSFGGSSSLWGFWLLVGIQLWGGSAVGDERGCGFSSFGGSGSFGGSAAGDECGRSSDKPVCGRRNQSGTVSRQHLGFVNLLVHSRHGSPIATMSQRLAGGAAQCE